MSRISKPENNDLDRISSFISRLQKHKETRIGYFDRTPDEIKLYLEGLEPGWKETTLIIEEEGKILGTIIAEYDIELQRVWIHGPMVDLIDQTEWHSQAVELYENLFRIIPTEINDYELYGERSNINLRKLAEDFDYNPTDPSCVLSFSRKLLTDLPILSLNPIREDFFEQFKR